MGLQEGGLRSPHTSFPHATPDPAAFSIPRPPSSVGARESGHPRSVNIRADNLSCSFLSRFSCLFGGLGVGCGGWGWGIWEGGGCGGGVEVVVVTLSSFSSNPDKTSSPPPFSALCPFSPVPPPPIPPPPSPPPPPLPVPLLFRSFCYMQSLRARMASCGVHFQGAGSTSGLCHFRPRATLDPGARKLCSDTYMFALPFLSSCV